MSKKKTTSSKKMEVAELTAFPIKFHIPDTIITRFATNITIQTLESEFKISFFEIKPELYFGSPAKVPSEVQADCVASVIVTPDRLSKFIGVLQEQLDKYNSRQTK